MANRRVNEALSEEHVNTIWAIAASRWCKGFLIGYTCMARRERFAGYKQNGWDYMIVLENGLTRYQALDLERRLQEACKKGAPSGPPHRRKYSPYHRGLSYRESAGQGSRDPTAPIHSVYMVWWE
jgi:hypothetical protein